MQDGLITAICQMSTFIILETSLQDLIRVLWGRNYQLEKKRFNIYELLSDVIKDHTERIRSDNKI
jgi:broad-specificity NMP kinase